MGLIETTRHMMMRMKYCAFAGFKRAAYEWFSRCNLCFDRYKFYQ